MKALSNIKLLLDINKTLKSIDPFKEPLAKAMAVEDYDTARDYIVKVENTWGDLVVEAFGIDLHVHGRENLPTTGPVVFAANHQSYLDPIVMVAAVRTIPFGFIAKEEVIKFPKIGPWAGRVCSVFIKRGDARAALRAIDDGVKLIEKGFSMGLFPEGTRSKGGPVIDFKKGSLRLATKPGVPIVPMSINGTHKCYEDNERRVKGIRVDITIHPMIPTAGLTKKEQGALGEIVQSVICSCLDERYQPISKAPAENEL